MRRRPMRCSLFTASGTGSRACTCWGDTTPGSYPCRMRIAILGAGKIGESLLAGLRSSGWTYIVATARREDRVAELRERHGVVATTANVEAVRGADVVVVAVKPQDIDALLAEVNGAVGPAQTV